MSIQTANWFAAETKQPGHVGGRLYSLVASFSMDATRSPSLSVIDAVTTVLDSSGQTRLTLYEYIDPDAFDDLVDASTDKESDVEVRFTIDEYLVIVRSPDTILIYEPE